MTGGRKYWAAAVLCGAVLLTVAALSAGADQRGGGAPGAGLGNLSSQDEAPAPPIKNADVAKAKADREQNIKDAARLEQLAAEVKRELESESAFTLSLASVKKADEMEKLSKKLHARLKANGANAPDPPSGMDASSGRGRN
jgi:hypothetical protein